MVISDKGLNGTSSMDTWCVFESLYAPERNVHYDRQSVIERKSGKRCVNSVRMEHGRADSLRTYLHSAPPN